jgi:hypothetical protein
MSRGKRPRKGRSVTAAVLAGPLPSPSRDKHRAKLCAGSPFDKGRGRSSMPRRAGKDRILIPAAGTIGLFLDLAALQQLLEARALRRAVSAVAALVSASAVRAQPEVVGARVPGAQLPAAPQALPRARQGLLPMPPLVPLALLQVLPRARQVLLRVPPLVQPALRRRDCSRSFCSASDGTVFA